MPLPEDLLREMKETIDTSKAEIEDLEETIASLREAGIDATEPEAELRVAREELRKLEAVYELEARRAGLL